MGSDSSESPDFDVVIVGAGPAGSATALHLVRRGHRVLLLDRAAFPRDKACSEYMSPETVRLLNGLGVLPALDRAGVPLRGTAVTAHRGAKMAGRFERATPQPFRPTGLALSRRLLDAALLDAARQAGAAVLEETAVTGLLREGTAVAGVEVRGREHGPIRARLVIGADGIRSVVARRLGGVRHGPIRRFGFVAHAEGVDGMGDQAELHVGRAGYMGLNPLGGGLTNLALVVPAAQARRAAGDPDAFLRESLESFPAVRRRIGRWRPARPTLVSGPFHSRARRVVADGALLVGDAADFFDPFTGEGICAALRGAELAAAAADRALRHPGPVTAGALSGYRHARRHAFAGKWAVERLVGYSMLWPALFDRAVGRLGTRAGMADTFIGVTGAFVPPSAVLNPLFLARMVL